MRAQTAPRLAAVVGEVDVAGPPAVLVGALLGDMVRYLLAGLVVILLGLILGFRPGGGVSLLSSAVLIAIFAPITMYLYRNVGRR